MFYPEYELATNLLTIAKKLRISRYKTKQLINALKKEGTVQPPYWGYILTEKAKNLNQYKERWQGSLNKKCANCNEPTKRATGCWDGINKNGNRIGGNMYDCNNFNCPIKKEKIEGGKRAEELEKAVKEENHSNNVDILEIKAARKKAGLTIRSAAQAIGVSLSTYCDYEYERKPMPPEKWQQVMTWVKETNND